MRLLSDTIEEFIKALMEDENREIELRNVPGQPETAEDMVNKYGTYNIQPTADTDNSFPKIAQGLAKPKNRKIK